MGVIITRSPRTRQPATFTAAKPDTRLAWAINFAVSQKSAAGPTSQYPVPVKPAASGIVTAAPSASNYASASAGLTLGDVTLVVLMSAGWSASGGNPGFIRSGSASDQGDFFILQGGTNLPWIRAQFFDAIKPSSGTAIPVGSKCVLAYRTSSSQDAAIFLNGQKLYSAGSLSFGSAIYNFGWQSGTSEYVDGCAGMLLYGAWLSDAELSALGTESAFWSRFTDTARRIWVPSAGGAPSHDATGALSAQSATIAGTATHLLLHTSTGALSGQSATIAGTALHPHTSSGALSAGSATIAGTALHPHTSTGALSGQAATIAGTAARSAAGAHGATGALSGQSATIAGTATHLLLHAATGALTGQAATIAGTAMHPHTSTGALSGQAASIAGTAAKTTVHPSTGALVGQAATIAGTATHTSPVTHTSTGALIADYAVIAGTASLNGGVTGVGSYEDAPRKRRFIQQVGNKLVVFNNAGAAIKALVAEEDRLAALAQSEADEAEKAAEYVSPDDVELPETIAASEVEETIPIAEIQQLAQRDDETDRINTLVKQQEYDALLALYHVLQERADDEATIEMLLMSL